MGARLVRVDRAGISNLYVADIGVGHAEAGRADCLS